MTTYRLWPSTNGPSSPSAYSGNFISGVAFCVTAEAWFEGYWWWVAGSGQSTSPVKCALWCVGYETEVSAVVIPGSVVTSGTLTAGQWNYIPLSTPIPLSIGGSSGMSPAVTGPSPATYVAAVGCNGSFPDTNNYWGTGQTEPDGITSGPLTAFSGKSASMPAPWPGNSLQPQGCFSVAGSDPSTTFPGSASNTDNFWVDVQIGDHSAAPADTSYRIWPNFPAPQSATPSIDTEQQTMGTEFTLSQACTLDNIWYYSPPGVTVLPSRCGIWRVSSQTEVSGTDNSSPSWTGAAGSGWVACAYSSVTLAAGDYKVAVYYGGGSEFYTESDGYFSSGGPGQNGVTNGPLTAPNTADASGGIQDTFTAGAWAYPATSGGTGGQARWVDVEVTPLGSSHTATAALTVTPVFSAARQRGKYRTGGLTVTPVFSAPRTRGHYRTGALEVIPVFAAVRIRGRYRSAALTVTPSFSAIPSGGAFAPPVFIYPAYWTAAWVQADTRVTVSPAGAQTATVTSAVLGESAATLYPPGPAVIYPSP